MSENHPSISRYLTPYVISIQSSFLSPADILGFVTKHTKQLVSPENISLINEEKTSITIDIIRALLGDMSYASFQGKIRHICLLYVDQTTIEAQNAVLKLLEEPPKNTQFWLFTQFPQVLLPTIISRCMEITWEQETTSTEEQQAFSIAAQKLLEEIATTSYRELIESAEKYPERVTAQTFVDSMLQIIHTKNSSNPVAVNTLAMNTLLETKLHLSANVSPKLALEHCFFLLKRILT